MKVLNWIERERWGNSLEIYCQQYLEIKYIFLLSWKFTKCFSYLGKEKCKFKKWRKDTSLNNKKKIQV